MRVWTKTVKKLIERQYVLFRGNVAVCTVCSKEICCVSGSVLSLYREIYIHFMTEHEHVIRQVEARSIPLKIHDLPAVMLVDIKPTSRQTVNIKLEVAKNLCSKNLKALINIFEGDSTAEKDEVLTTVQALAREICSIYPIPVPKLKNILLKLFFASTRMREKFAEIVEKVDAGFRVDLRTVIRMLILTICRKLPVPKNVLVEVILDIVSQMRSDGVIPRSTDNMTVIDILNEELSKLEKKGCLVRINDLYRAV